VFGHRQAIGDGLVYHTHHLFFIPSVSSLLFLHKDFRFGSNINNPFSTFSYLSSSIPYILHPLAPYFSFIWTSYVALAYNHPFSTLSLLAFLHSLHFARSTSNVWWFSQKVPMDSNDAYFLVWLSSIIRLAHLHHVLLGLNLMLPKSHVSLDWK
jgi:hypothetical protein